MRLFPFRADSALMALGLTLALYAATPSVQAAVVARGTFQSKEAGLVASGAFEVQENAGKYSLVVKSDFQVSEGPDLFFAFHPLAAASVNGGNAKTGTFRVDPMLRSLRGAQTFEIGAGFDPAKYQSLIIHCWKFNHLYGAGVLVKPDPTSLPPVRPASPSAGKKVSRERTLVFEGSTPAIRSDATGRRRHK